MPGDSRFDVTDSRFDVDQYEPAEPARPRSWVSSCLLGCLVTAIVLSLIAAAGVWWLSKNWRGLVSSIGSDAINQGIDQSELPQQEKDEIKAQIARASSAFADGSMTPEQMAELMKKLVESPLMTSLLVTAIEKKYVDPSGLADEEKAAGRTTLRRFLRGSLDSKIDRQGIDAVMVHVADRQADGKTWELRDQVTDEDLRAFLKAAQEQADKAQIPAEPEDIDTSDEFKRIIDEALQPN